MNDAALATTLQNIAALLGSQRPDLAASAAAAARERFPQAAEAARLQAIALLQLGRPGEARTALEAARTLAPQSVEVLGNLGSVLLAEGDAGAAVAMLEGALALAPGHPQLLNGLGNARRAAGDPAGAAQAYADATRAAPRHAGAWLNLAATLLSMGHVDDAEEHVRQALMLAPDYAQGSMLLGHVLAAKGRFADAQAAYARGAAAAPREAGFAYQAGLMAEEQRQPGAAARWHAQALAIDPGLAPALGQLVFLRRQLCEWDELDALSARLRAAVAANAAGVSPFGFLAEPASASEQLHCARTFARGIEAAAAPLRTRLNLARATARDAAPLRVGFASNGLGNHPTGLLTVALFEALAGLDLQIHLFATARPDASPLQVRLQAAAHAWHDLAGLVPAAQAQRIHAQGIDVLVDLRGYAGGGIAETLALRPAPVQVGWLAYPGTSGAPWLDHYIADRIVLPPSLEAAFSEHVIRLPRCFQPCDTTREVGTPPPRTALGLPDAGTVYACFNNSYKLNPASFERMLAVLRGVPDGVLWLLCGPDGADDRLRGEARRRGIDPARLVFTPRRPHAEYLALYRHADLFLDTAPYNAHTTASDALYAGCPLLTVPGDTFAGRVAASLNHHVGMPQMNVADDAAFIAQAIALGRDAAVRAALRAELAERRQDSSLFDMAGFARDLAAALHGIAAAPGGPPVV